MQIRQLVPPVLVCGLAACAFDSAGPYGGSLYLLRRIGTQPLPAPAFSSPGAPLVLADTMVLVPPRDRGKETFVVTRITVLRSTPGGDVRSAGRFQAVREGDLLTVDNCPLGSFCIASLVYQANRFAIVGDSLFEQIPSGSPELPRVYGLVRR